MKRKITIILALSSIIACIVFTTSFSNISNEKTTLNNYYESKSLRQKHISNNLENEEFNFIKNSMYIKQDDPWQPYIDKLTNYIDEDANSYMTYSTFYHNNIKIPFIYPSIRIGKKNFYTSWTKSQKEMYEPIILKNILPILYLMYKFKVFVQNMWNHSDFFSQYDKVYNSKSPLTNSESLVKNTLIEYLQKLEGKYADNDTPDIFGAASTIINGYNWADPNTPIKISTLDGLLTKDNSVFNYFMNIDFLKVNIVPFIYAGNSHDPDDPSQIVVDFPLDKASDLNGDNFLRNYLNFGLYFNRIDPYMHSRARFWGRMFTF